MVVVRRPGAALAPAAGVWPRAPASARRANSSTRMCCASAPIHRTCRSRDESGEGFENKLAELVAEKTGRKSVAYTWFPMVTGFVRNTLRANRCDIIMGYAQGDELVQNTNAYYRSTYVLVYRKGGGLDGVETIEDPQARRQDGSASCTARRRPPTWPGRPDEDGQDLSADGRHALCAVDGRSHDQGPGRRRRSTRRSLWGPMAGYYAKKSGADLAWSRWSRKRPARAWHTASPWACARPTRNGSGRSTGHQGQSGGDQQDPARLQRAVDRRAGQADHAVERMDEPDRNEDVAQGNQGKERLGSSRRAFWRRPVRRLAARSRSRAATGWKNTARRFRRRSEARRWSTTAQAEALWRDKAGRVLRRHAARRRSRPTCPQARSGATRCGTDIPGSIWLANVGYGAIPEETDALFSAESLAVNTAATNRARSCSTA